MKIFDLDGPFQKYGSMLFDLLALNILWFLITFFSLGILGGPALCGLYSGIYAGVLTGEGYSFKSFFTRLRKRLIPSILIGLFCTLFLVLSIFNILMILLAQFGTILLLPVYAFILIEISFVATYAFPLLAYSNLGVGDIIKTSFMLANKHLPLTALASIVNGVAITIMVLIFLGFVQFFVFLFFGMSVIVLINSQLIIKMVLKRYDFFIGSNLDI